MRKTQLAVRRLWRAWAAVGAVGLLALGARFLDRVRPAALDFHAASEIRVTSGADAGIGTLRDAIMAADRSSSRVRIVVQVAHISVATPLPPVINPLGVVFESSGEPATIEAASPQLGPLLDIAGRDAVISRLRIVGNADQGILLRSNGARISRVRIERSATAIQLAPGSDDLVVDRSEFYGNGIGIDVSSAVRHVSLVNNRFRGQRGSAVWAVSPAPPTEKGGVGLSVRENRFEGDNQPLVVMNQNARIEGNTVAGARTTAFLINGASAVIRANRVRSGIGFGVTLEELEHGVVSDNEIDHNCAGAILVRNARNTSVTSNRVYANGYGIVMVMGAATSPNTVADNLVARQFVDGLFIIGGSPLVHRNRVLENRHAGVRIASIRNGESEIVASAPSLSANLITGNDRDLLEDEFRPHGATVPTQYASDCAWRLGSEPEQPVAALRD